MNRNEFSLVLLLSGIVLMGLGWGSLWLVGNWAMTYHPFGLWIICSCIWICAGVFMGLIGLGSVVSDEEK